MPIYAFAGQKGGSSKTTMALAAAAELTARGRRVLLVDADPQGTSRTWAAIAAEGAHQAPATVSMGDGMHLPGQLDTIAEPFEAVIIDCPPRHGDVMRSAMMIADVVILPCGPSGLDAWAMAESLELVSGARALRPNLRAAILITRIVARTAIGTNAREALSNCGLPVFSTQTHYRVAYQEALTGGMGIAQYAPGTPAAAEVVGFVNELEHFNKTGDMNNGQATDGSCPQAA